MLACTVVFLFCHLLIHKTHTHVHASNHRRPHLLLRDNVPLRLALSVCLPLYCTVHHTAHNCRPPWCLAYHAITRPFMPFMMFLYNASPFCRQPHFCRCVFFLQLASNVLPWTQPHTSPSPLRALVCLETFSHKTSLIFCRMHACM